MVRIAGINIPDNKRIEVALTYIYGIGLSTSQKILKELSVDVDTRAKNLTAEDANRLREVIEKKYRVEGELHHVVKQNIKRLKEIGCYRGMRHQKGRLLSGHAPSERSPVPWSTHQDQHAHRAGECSQNYGQRSQEIIR